MLIMHKHISQQNKYKTKIVIERERERESYLPLQVSRECCVLMSDTGVEINIVNFVYATGK